MITVSKFTVIPQLPERIDHLLDVANNAWWCWNHDAIELFQRIDRELWKQLNQNPRQMLGEVSQLRLEELANDESFLAHLARVWEALETYRNTNLWFDRNAQAPKDLLVAYMSAEFAIHESLRLYSGGLGVLAGDHLKAASDLGMPLIGIGLLYQQGYFRQYLNADGWQQESYPRNDFYNMPIELMKGKDGLPLMIDVPYPNRNVKAKIWRAQIGRVPLYLLDSDCDENSAEDRLITDKLYGGGNEARVRQEILLGMGGVKAMQAMNITPTVYHMNEGHAAFMGLQRIQDLMQGEGLSFDSAVESVKAGNVFTTHTPVPAGNDMFDPGLITHYFKDYCRSVGISMDHLLSLGRQDQSNLQELFCMTVLALRFAAGANGVSKLHGEVARDMWKKTWSHIPVHEVPITSITNGVHNRTWISSELSDLYDRYLGPRWVDRPDDQSIWHRIDEVPDTELWRCHERCRERLVEFARQRLYNQYNARGGSSLEMRICREVLDPEVLTIGFARRFATYKRGNLILRDKERLTKILLHAKRPVQLIIAGKAHPADQMGKQVIRELFHFAREVDVRHSIILVENYDMNVARYMVQGVDCWLNNPRRPMEASGTSGMKAAANGALNISIPDGWWCEAENLGANGWSIGRGETYASTDEQDEVESEALYDLLEQEIAPLFYKKANDGLPRDWIACMKTAIRTCGPLFNTYRMVQEYGDRCYIPASVRSHELSAKKRTRAIALADWKQKVRASWSQIRVEDIHTEGQHDGLAVGASLKVRARVHLGALQDEDVSVEVYYGPLDHHGKIVAGHTTVMSQLEEAGEHGLSVYSGHVTCETTGQLGFAVRVIPKHADLAQKHETMLITWG